MTRVFSSTLTKIMRNTPFQLSIIFLIGCTLHLHAATLIDYNGADNYVSSNENFTNRATLSGDGPYLYTRAFTDTSILSPSADYTGPAFYGGYLFTSSTVNNDVSRLNFQAVRNFTSGDQIYLQAFFNGGWTGSLQTLHGIYVFNQADFNPGFDTGQVSLEGISIDFAGEIESDDSSINFEGRLAVNVGGNYYLAQSTIDLNNPDGNYSISGSALQNELWAIYDPTSNLNFDSGSASFGTLALSAISGVGIYFEEDGWNGNTDNRTFALGFERFTAEGSLIPEPSAMSLRLGTGCLVMAFLVRRRKKR